MTLNEHEALKTLLDFADKHPNVPIEYYSGPSIDPKEEKKGFDPFGIVSIVFCVFMVAYCLITSAL